MTETPLMKAVLLYVELHKLIALGRSDFPEAEQVRDELDPLWSAASVDEQEFLAVLSERLYGLTEAAKGQSDGDVQTG